LNEFQQKAVEELKNKNKEYIKEIDKLLNVVIKEYGLFDAFEHEFWDLMNAMDKASAKLPYVPFNNAYCIKNNNFSIPQGPALAHPFFALSGGLSDEFSYLSEDFMKGIEDDYDKKAELLSKTLSAMFQSISELLSNIIASNSITKRLSGLEDKVAELEKISKHCWYPRELSQHEYSLKGQFPVPPIIGYPQAALPYHRDLIIRYDHLFRSKELHIAHLKRIKEILKYINEFLPFAELVPLKESNGVHIDNTNVVTPHHTKIGSHNTFDGEINIGNKKGE